MPYYTHLYTIYTTLVMMIWLWKIFYWKCKKKNYKNQYSDILVYFNLHFRKNAMLVEFISLKISLKSEFGAFLIISIMKMWIIYQIMRTLILRFSEFSLQSISQKYQCRNYSYWVKRYKNVQYGIWTEI